MNKNSNNNNSKTPSIGGGRGRLLIFDNYDSFTYNLVHAVKKLGFTNVEVHRNDKISLSEINRFDKIILSPGPGLPQESGILKELIETYAPTKSILGVCLGEQAIGEVFGAKLENLAEVFHGVSTKIKIIADDILFYDMPATMEVGRYHSWAVSKEDFPDSLVITAVDEDGMIMALKHKKFNVRGVQFHPESILTPQGEQMLENWLNN